MEEERSDHLVRSYLDAAQQDALAELLRKAEDYGFHHGARNKHHYRTWSIVSVLYELIAVLVATPPESEEEETGNAE